MTYKHPFELYAADEDREFKLNEVASYFSLTSCTMRRWIKGKGVQVALPASMKKSRWYVKQSELAYFVEVAEGRRLPGKSRPLRPIPIIYTIAKVAEMFDVTVRTITRWAAWPGFSELKIIRFGKRCYLTQASVCRFQNECAMRVSRMYG
jgi:hypothetical protein